MIDTGKRMPAHEKDEEDKDCKPEIIMVLGPSILKSLEFWIQGGVNWATPTSQYPTCSRVCTCNESQSMQPHAGMVVDKDVSFIDIPDYVPVFVDDIKRRSQVLCRPDQKFPVGFRKIFLSVRRTVNLWIGLAFRDPGH